jgi:hypothetical protein
MPLPSRNSTHSACNTNWHDVDLRQLSTDPVQSLTIRIRPHHYQWLAQQALNASRSTVVRLLIQQAIDSQPQQQAPTNAR